MAERNRPGDAGDPADDEVFTDADAVADDNAAVDEVDGDDDVEGEALTAGGGTAVKERKDQTAKKDRTRRRRGPIARIGGFFREVVSELRKVIWPTRRELLTYTTIVIGFVTVMTAIVGLLDYGFGKGIFWAFGG
jgi:preprotein translocase subunit SecE